MELKIVEKWSENWACYVKLEVVDPSGGKSLIEEGVKKIAGEIVGNYPNWEVADYYRVGRGNWFRFKGEWYRCFGGEDVKFGDFVFLKINVFHWS